MQPIDVIISGTIDRSTYQAIDDVDPPTPADTFDWHTCWHTAGHPPISVAAVSPREAVKTFWLFATMSLPERQG